MAVLRVPSEFGSMEAAQNNGQEGDTILLAPGAHLPPITGMTKWMHIKAEDESHVSNTKLLAAARTSGNPGHRTALPLAFQSPPTTGLTKLYIEGVQLAEELGTSVATFGLSLQNVAPGALTAEIELNRCQFYGSSGYSRPDYGVTYQQQGGVIRLRNCYINNFIYDGYEIDNGELHLHRCRLETPPFEFSQSSKGLDTADWVSEATEGYSTGYGTWMAPFFMEESTFRYRGRVEIDFAAPGASYPVYLHRRATGALVMATTCDPVTGEYEFAIPAEEAQYEHLIVSVADGIARPLVHYPVNPEYVP